MKGRRFESCRYALVSAAYDFAPGNVETVFGFERGKSVSFWHVLSF
jgi:hypothetical protein